MSTNRASTTNGTSNGQDKTYFESQREILVTEIAQVRPLSNETITISYLLVNI
jgi:DASH complex subunit DAD1